MGLDTSVGLDPNGIVSTRNFISIFKFSMASNFPWKKHIPQTYTPKYWIHFLVFPRMDRSPNFFRIFSGFPRKISTSKIRCLKNHEGEWGWDHATFLVVTLFSIGQTFIGKVAIGFKWNKDIVSKLLPSFNNVMNGQLWYSFIFAQNAANQ